MKLSDQTLIENQPWRSCNMSPLWVVTSYFNPSKYRRRYKNFKIFRQLLNAPLMVVELGRGGDFQLTKEDGDIVLQLSGEDRIWQKERLLNIGIQHLPDHVEYVAWVDCDVVFEDQNWANEATRHLRENGGLLQLFRRVHHLTQESTEASSTYDSIVNSKTLFEQSAVAIDTVNRDRFAEALHALSVPNRPADPLPLPWSNRAYGLAWAARRQDLFDVGLYDRAIVGSGDLILVHSILNILQPVFEDNQFSDAMKAHILAWAAEASKRIGTKIAHLPSDIFHLWHGDFENRRYRDRHKLLNENNYDPQNDVRFADNGTLAWSNPSGSLAYDVASYFDMRCEDG